MTYDTSKFGAKCALGLLFSYSWPTAPAVDFTHAMYHAQPASADDFTYAIDIFMASPTTRPPRSVYCWDSFIELIGRLFAFAWYLRFIFCLL